MRRVVLLGLVAAALAAPASGGRLPLATRLAAALAVPGNPPTAQGAVAIDLRSGRAVFARHANLALAPASNEKLAVTFAALQQFGTSWRFKTMAFDTGTQDPDGVVHGNLFLKGFGDPSLTTARLDRLAAAVAEVGITRVTGRLLADESWFDAHRAAPGWKQEYLVNECPPISALVVDRAEYDHHVARDPAVAAAGIFRRLLRAHGVITGEVGRGRTPDDANPIDEVDSPTVANIVAVMDRESDNFRAEMLIKDLAAEAYKPGTTAGGATIVRNYLADANVPLDGVVIADGSGLSQLDRLTPNAVAGILVAAWNDPTIKLPFWNALPVAGESGTLENRMRHTAARGAVRAKTGTTDTASALSGYASDRYVFAVMQNGSPVRTWSARRAQDRFAIALASAAQQGE